MTPLAQILSALPQPARRTSRGYEARCPAHEDAHASLSITTGEDGRVLLKCHAGCEAAAIVGAIGLRLADLFPPRPAHEDPEAVYAYRDEAGALLFEVLRFPGKRFRQRRPDGAGTWLWNIQGIRRVLYRLPDLTGHPAVFVVEGEKDTEALWGVGLPATCNPHGAGKWRDDYPVQLKAAGVARVCVLPDNDPQGEAHARHVARSCHDAGLTVRVLPLLGLPPKGDVTDWLRTHTRDDLLEAARVCPLFDASRSVTAGFKLELTSLADLLSEPDAAVDWLVADRIPAGGVVLLAGKPKAGKSTLARDLAYALVTGQPWLGWYTTGGPVWYLAFEDKRSEIRRHFRQMGATGDEPLRLFFGQAGADLLPALHELATRERPIAIIIDTLQRLIGARDMCDYAEITTRCAPLLQLARDTGATVILVHHANKYGEGLDSVLGSTALSGSVDNVFVLSRTEEYRTLQSIQRIGPDLEPLVVRLNPTTGRVEAAGSKWQADQAAAADRILEALTDQAEPVREHWIEAHVEGRRRALQAGLRLLVRTGKILRTGQGGKKDPYEYVVPRSGTHVPVRTPGTSILIPSLSSTRPPTLFSESGPETPEYPNVDGPDSGTRKTHENGGAGAVSSPDSGTRQFRVFGSGTRAVRQPGCSDGSGGADRPDPANVDGADSGTRASEDPR